MSHRILLLCKQQFPLYIYLFAWPNFFEHCIGKHPVYFTNYHGLVPRYSKISLHCDFIALLKLLRYIIRHMYVCWYCSKKSLPLNIIEVTPSIFTATKSLMQQSDTQTDDV